MHLNKHTWVDNCDCSIITANVECVLVGPCQAVDDPSEVVLVSVCGLDRHHRGARGRVLRDCGLIRVLKNSIFLSSPFDCYLRNTKVRAWLPFPILLDVKVFR